MPIKSDAELDEKLAQMARLYRAALETWKRTNAEDQTEIAKWVAAGGKILEKLTEVLADIEDYTGCMELRLIWEQLKAVRQEREQPKTKPSDRN